MNHARHGPGLGAISDRNAGSGFDFVRRETVIMVCHVHHFFPGSRRCFPQGIRQQVQKIHHAVGNCIVSVQRPAGRALACYRPVAHADSCIEIRFIRLHILGKSPGGHLPHIRIGQAQGEKERIGGLLAFSVPVKHIVFRMGFPIKFHRNQLAAPLMIFDPFIIVQPVAFPCVIFMDAAAAVQIRVMIHFQKTVFRNEVFIDRRQGQAGIRRGDFLRITAV